MPVQRPSWGFRYSEAVIYVSLGILGFRLLSVLGAQQKSAQHTHRTRAKLQTRKDPQSYTQLSSQGRVGNPNHHHAETGQRLTYKQNIIPSSSSSRDFQHHRHAPQQTLQGRSPVRKLSSGDDIVRLLPHVFLVQPLQCLKADTLVPGSKAFLGLGLAEAMSLRECHSHPTNRV